MAYKSPFNQDPTLKKAINNVFGKTNLPSFGDKKYGGERLYEQSVKGSDYSVPVSDFNEISGAPAGSTTSTPKGRIDRLKARKDATSNEAKKARIQGKIERTKTRQSSRAERIKDRNIKKLQKTKQRQKIKNIRQGLDPNAGMKDYKSEFKKMGEDFGKKDLSIKKSSSLSDVTSTTGFVPSSGGKSSIKPEITNTKTKTKITTPEEKNTFFDDKKIPSTSDILGNELISQAIRSKYPDISIETPTKMIDPLTNMEVTPQPPMPANQMGTAKPVFNQTAQDVANQVYGGLDQRQMSMPQPPMFMTAKQEKAFGPGSEVYESGNTAIYEGLKEKE
jgi:hypothetical protein